MNDSLAIKMRPKSLDDIIGQEHLVGAGRIIRRMVEVGKLTSMILYGPPGVGKTSIASAIAGTSQLAFRTFNATIDSKKKLQEIVEEAKFSNGIVLLLDEIHRLDKTKQDFLLPYLESGLVIMIGATTENPYFSIIPAIRSRVQIFELYALSEEQVKRAIIKVLNKSKDIFGQELRIDDQAFQFLLSRAKGDLRAVYSSLELAALSSINFHITLDDMENSLQVSYQVMDKDGDSHYDVLSALQKSIRGSDVDASLHYAARLIKAGDLDSLARRLIVIAYEDISLANPEAAMHTVTAMEACKKIGFPEASILIANVVVDLALSPKSNAAMKAMNKALSDLDRLGNMEIPSHLRDSHYKGAEDLGRGLHYLYPHDYSNHWVDQHYLPENLQRVSYYQPDDTGKYERALKQTLDRINHLKK